MLAVSVSVIGAPAGAVTRPDPVAALKRQLDGHGGVRLNAVYRIVWGPKKDHVSSRSRAVYKFGGGGIVAIDVRYSKFSPGDSRSIIFPDRAYGWEREHPAYMPAGKSWFLETKKNDLELVCGQIRLSDSATLRHVLATTTVKRPAGVYDGTRTTLYEGSTTIGDLYKLNPGLRVDGFEKPTGQYASYTKLPVTWRLWLGSDQLVRRCQTRYDEPDSLWNTKDRSVSTADVRLSGWGEAVDIKPPPAELVATRDELVFPDDD
ncbi:unnamed protein product [[Actinomadura] parvosata subsp. kistnae]|uniref:Uncharacterized protein n=1 Tax=[Actinomadura] parvosata subsp. kistnae TaxID=1909395 RepID=A0A1U9ZZF4_9ACTN|nr:hypothetical protein [Nonomuraea sp. ATCC 55076]AQZ63343.1 hypothetical protein BKM31_19425 [Nonomuraea sp. ATCC 55076]SPL99048.1 unnamed protein product [Actinomadura parvosata subsp. kistnae]